MSGLGARATWRRLEACTDGSMETHKLQHRSAFAQTTRILRTAPIRSRLRTQPAQRSRNDPTFSRQSRVVVRAEGEGEDDDFESKLTRLKRSKPDKKESKAKEDTPKQQKYDFSGEKVHFESAPHRGDAATNIALGATLVWLPLSIASIGRAIFVKYRFTDKRLSVITEAPWKSEQLDAAYQEVEDVKTVGRGIGLWGDMVVTLRNKDKIELRSLPKFLELKKYILERRDALSKDSPAGSAASSGQTASTKGF